VKKNPDIGMDEQETHKVEPDGEVRVAATPPDSTPLRLEDTAAAKQTVLVEVNEHLLISVIEAQSTLEMQAEALQEVRRSAEFDALTALPNRVLLFDRFAQAIANAHRRRGRLAVLFLDIDDFKAINDRGGHAAGDLALKNAARRLLSAVRAVDTVCRFGGDEFVILITEVALPSDVGLIAAKVIAALGIADSEGAGLAGSIGICIYPDDGVDPQALIACADAAMYRAKQAGGGRYRRHTTDIEAGHLSELTSTAAIPRNTDARPIPSAEQGRLNADLRETNERLLLAALREIDERARTDAHLQLALDAAEMGSWEVDIKTGLVTCSPRYDRIFGHVDPFRDRDLHAVIAQFVPEDREAVDDAFRLALIDGTLEFERRIDRSSDGQTRWLHFKGKTDSDAGETVRIAGVVSDVTERRAIDDQLRQAQKMEAVGQLTGGIAHDFNNLLLVIGGSLDLLARRLPAEQRTDRLLAAARRGVANGAKLNSQLLAFARRQDLQPEVFSIGQRLTTLEDLLQRAVDATITIAVVCEPHLWNCIADPHQLEVAVLNLAINARDAMAHGGRLTLSASNRTTTDAFAAAWGASGGDYVAISVVDTGVGMSPAVIARAFEPFFTTKPVGQGTGLGLSQVYGFARQSNGFVALQRGEAGGTSVTIYLPRTKRLTPEKIADALAAVPSSGAVTVLAVEDDAEVRAITHAMLSDLNYTVIQVATGEAALALIESDQHVDLVFSDVVMPGMSGIELATALRLRRPALPILLTSGYTAQRTMPDQLGGKLSLLRKPYDQAALSLALRSALGAMEAGQVEDNALPDDL
jgi:diguanylate cyclase (GGDEF)-like protein/PAS domain S-box-containing protein